MRCSGSPANELPGVGDSVTLEVVAEGEVAQHLEERVMPAGVSDLLEIVVLAPRAYTFLAGGRTDVVAGFLAEKGALELHHAGVGEQQGGIVLRLQR
jgi:hypothetical protein